MEDAIASPRKGGNPRDFDPLLGSTEPVQAARPSAPSPTTDPMIEAIGMLTCVGGPDEGAELTLSQGVYCIGRGRDNHMVLKDIACSRQHLEIRVHGNKVQAFDLGSGNGTRLNGQQIHKSSLRSDDRIEIGNTILRYQPLRPVTEVSDKVAVPPRPAPRPEDLWPETETLLSELESSRKPRRQRRKKPRSQPPQLDAVQQQPPPVLRPPARPADRSPIPAASPALSDPSETMAAIRAAIGTPRRSGTTAWILAGIGALVLAGAVVLALYLTDRRADRDRAEAASLTLRATQALAQGDYPEAKRQFEQALVLVPGHAEASTGLQLLLRTTQSAQSMERSARLIAERNYDGARHALQGVAEGTPQYQKVAAELQRIKDIEIQELLTQARTMLTKGELDDAEREISHALDLESDHKEARMLLGELEREREKIGAGAERPPEVTPDPPTIAQPTHVKKPPRKPGQRKPRPAPRSTTKLNEDEAKQLFQDGINAYKAGDHALARRLLKKVVSGRPTSSLYYQKAQSFLIRKL